MRICYIADAGSIHTQRWVKYFADKGHEVHLISLTPLGDGNIGNTELYVLKKFRPQIRIISFLINLLPAAFQVRKLIKKINPAILHAHYITEYGFLGALSGFHPFVLTAWGSDVLVDTHEFRVLRYFVQFALKRADVITTTAEFMGDYLSNEFKLPKSNIVRIPWGIDLKTFHRDYRQQVEKLREELKISESSPIVLSSRVMGPYGRIWSIVDAVPHVIYRYPDVIFIFLRGYGTDKFETVMKSRAEKLGVINNIQFIPRLIKPQEMAIYLNMSLAVISVPKTDQFAASIMEGMICGAIPIVSNIEVYKQSLQDGRNAFFVNPDNPREIAEKIVYCIEHPELKEEFYKINKRIIEEKENWDENAEKMGELYESLKMKEGRWL